VPELGIWSGQAGGFITTQLYSQAEAETEMHSLVTQAGEEADDLSIVEMCPDHDEQPKDSCEICESEEDDDA
jgi:hypothetical protein